MTLTKRRAGSSLLEPSHGDDSEEDIILPGEGGGTIDDDGDEKNSHGHKTHHDQQQQQEEEETPPPPLQDFMVILALSSLMLLQILSLPYLLYSLCCGNLLFPSLFLFFLFFPRLPKHVQPRHHLLRGRLGSALVRYFSYDAIIDTPGLPNRQYLFVQFPHGTFPIGPMISSIHLDRFTGGSGIAYCLCANFVFCLPLFRYYFTMIGGVPASRDNLRQLKQLGHHASVVVGGLAEMFMVHPDREEVLLRRGFMREALILGYPVVPTYTFGNNRVFDLYFGSKWLSRTLRFPCCYFAGRFCLPVPYKRPLLLVTGRPLEVQQTPEPTDEQVEKLLSSFREELTRVYYKHRPLWETRDLHILEEGQPQAVHAPPPPRSS